VRRRPRRRGGGVAAALVAGSRGDDLRQPPPSVASRAIRRNSLASLANSTSARPSAARAGSTTTGPAGRTSGAEPLDRRPGHTGPELGCRADQPRASHDFQRFPIILRPRAAPDTSGVLSGRGHGRTSRCAVPPEAWQST